ncbi:cob(I)yrinic acid a,c-diamide adenosyltransferase [Flavobacteriaceae bacterium XHP0103]|uniref:cob(I)yrinic acid a,c-diamide adenosyltransferase n=1 Tax=Marixanthotalea marina TaxID=2844359 RepID=UPI002989C6F8|nr:cob(I)yrinic acid a,c-diamide adenosyltransferase [Marixanthotalea marina]MBU3821773.1 cob(I)yrinic acid a,c-diamide adenosyltransferase [Marixanthotalea marina]
MKIYTKTGDAGTTGLIGGTRVPKNHIRIESYGSLDELNSYLGLVRDQDINQHHKSTLIKVQEKLFVIGAVLATDPNKEILKNGKKRLNISKVSTKDIDFLEQEIDLMNETLPPMTHFVLPGGHQTVSFCHIARCVCRRSERLIVALHQIESLDPNILTYLNRLSDYLFVLARKLTYDLQADEIKWIPEKE